MNEKEDCKRSWFHLFLRTSGLSLQWLWWNLNKICVRTLVSEFLVVHVFSFTKVHQKGIICKFPGFVFACFLSYLFLTLHPATFLSNLANKSDKLFSCDLISQTFVPIYIFFVQKKLTFSGMICSSKSVKMVKLCMWRLRCRQSWRRRFCPKYLIDRKFRKSCNIWQNTCNSTSCFLWIYRRVPPELFVCERPLPGNKLEQAKSLVIFQHSQYLVQVSMRFHQSEITSLKRTLPCSRRWCETRLEAGSAPSSWSGQLAAK